MERLDADIGPSNATLHETPEVLQSVCVDATIDVLHGMVYNLMDILSSQITIGAERIGIERRSSLYMLANLGREMFALLAGNDGCTDFPAALEQSQDRNLIFPACPGNATLALAQMHVAGLAADVGFVRFDFP